MSFASSFLSQRACYLNWVFFICPAPFSGVGNISYKLLQRFSEGTFTRDRTMQVSFLLNASRLFLNSLNVWMGCHRNGKKPYKDYLFLSHLCSKTQ